MNDRIIREAEQSLLSVDPVVVGLRAQSLGLTQPTGSVRQRLIAAGEFLFAERGVSSVSIRDIASEAQVSLAALNYHFGSKDKMLAEIFATRALPIVAERLRLLAELQTEGRNTLEAVIHAFLQPALAAEGGNKIFVKLRARMSIEPGGANRGLHANAFNDSNLRYIATLQGLLPQLPPIEVTWRFHFLLGAMVYTMADNGRIQSMTDGMCDPGDSEQALKQIVPFLASGFRAPAVGTAPARVGKPKNRTSLK